MDDELNLGMFKAYDIRTTVDRLSEKNAQALIRAVAAYFKDICKAKKVVLGRDARLGVPALMQMATDMMPLYGLEVIMNPLQVSTPQFYYSCMQNPDSCAVMFTASHNPGHYIGLKLLSQGMQTIAMGCGPGGGIDAIKALYIKDAHPEMSPNRGKLRIKSYLDSYVDYSMALAGLKGSDSLKGLNILADFLCGAAGIEIAQALDMSGANLVTRHIVPDGQFPIGDPNPIVESSIASTRKLMENGGFDFGFAYDGDGDRMDILTSTGEQLAPNFNLSILIDQFKAIYAPVFKRIGIYSDIKASPLAMACQAKQDVEVQMIRNGHSYIKTTLSRNIKRGFVAACEESAHYYMNFPYDINDLSKGFAATENTLFFTLLTSKVWSQHPEKYEQAMRIQNSVYRVREWPVFFNHSQDLEKALSDTEKLFAGRDYNVFKTSAEGDDFDATLMRKGLGEQIDKDTELSGHWLQIAQRNSRSEEGMARWELVGTDKAEIDEAVRSIKAITEPYILSGAAKNV
ncbi:MAG: hypothetical protein PHI83_09725 [Sphaerochaetaceae bacterium]|jgi:phosphomannomutase|nr:hypothetical protein [Sphaerochaetaceae bacterium]